MAETIKGINVVIGAETTGLSKALSDVNKQSKDIQSELRQVEKLLKLDPKNTELLAQKQKLLAQAVSNTQEKLDRLKTAQEQVNQQFASGDISEGQYRAFQREIVATEQQLKKLEQQGQETKRSLADLGASLQNTGGKLHGVGQTMALGVTAPVVAAGAAAVKFASDMAESTNKVNVAFGDSADKVKAWADTTLKSYGIAEGSALDMAALFGDMGTAMGQSQEEAAKMSMNLVGLAGDLASFKNIGIEQAQDALKGIFTGEGEALKTLGIVMQDSTLKAYALAKGYNKSYEDMSQAEKVALRYAFVMDAAKNAQGDFARTSDGTANQLRIMQESLKELAASIGEVLLPIITPIMQKFNEWIQQFGELDDGTKKIIIVIAGIVAALGPLLLVLGPIVSVIGSVIGVIGALGAASAAGATGIGILTTAFPVLGGVIAAITGPIGIAVAAIAGLIAIGVLLYRNWDDIKAKLSEVWGVVSDFFTKAIPAAINTALEWFKQLPGKVIEFLNQLPEKIGYIIGLALGNIVKFGLDAINWAITEVPKFIESIIQFYMELPGKIWELLVAAYEKVKEWGKNLLDWTKTEIPKIITSIIDFFKALPGKLFEIGVDVVKGLWDGIKSMVGWIGDKISGFVRGIVDGFKDGMEISSPSKVMAEIGKNISLGLAEGMAGAAGIVDKALSGLLNTMIIRADMAMAGTGVSNNTTYNNGGNNIYITVQDGEDLLRTLHRMGVDI